MTALGGHRASITRARPRSSLRRSDQAQCASGHWADDESGDAPRFSPQATSPPHYSRIQSATPQQNVIPSPVTHRPNSYDARLVSSPWKESVSLTPRPISPPLRSPVQTPIRHSVPQLKHPIPRRVSALASHSRVQSPIGKRVASPVQQYHFAPVIEDDDDDSGSSQLQSISARLDPSRASPHPLPSTSEGRRRLLTPLTISPGPTSRGGTPGPRSPHSPILSALQEGRLTPMSEFRQQSLQSALRSTSHRRVDLRTITFCDNTPEARGAFGEVWRCAFPSGGVMAAKRIWRKGDSQDNDPKQDLLRYLLREVLPWCDVDHPNIVRFIGYSFDAESAWMFSDWQSNGNASEYIRKHPKANRLKLVGDVIKGLAHLHSLSPAVVHGDIKPENVVIDTAGVAKLTDFGLSNLLDGSFAGGFFSSNSFRGTLRYADPTLTFNLPKTVYTDMWAFGWLAYVIVTGISRPYDWLANDFAVYQALGNYHVPRREAGFVVPYPEVMWPMLAGCWAKESSERWSASDVARYLGR